VRVARSSDTKLDLRISRPDACYIPLVRELVRQHPRFFFWTTLAAVALRLLFVCLSPQVTEDSRIYADIANNWLSHGIYGTTEAGRVIPTYIRLPGYPAFLAIIFAIFGKDNFRAVLLIQILIDVGTCFVIADLARRTTSLADGSHPGTRSYKASKFAFLAAAVCPFFANYAGAVLTETLEIFMTALALDFAVVGLESVAEGRLNVRAAIACGLAIAAAILLRPDGGILLIAVEAYLAFLLFAPTAANSRRNTRHLLYMGVTVAIVAVAPLIPWTLRNLQTMHRFEPLTPRYANNPGDYVPLGFNRWVKTWMADYVSVQEIYWQEPGEEIDASKLPSRAFDSPEQKQRTIEVLNRYNQGKEIDERLDAQFAALADKRIHSAPLRYYLWLPLLRIADMWLRPRTELTQADPRWWEFNDDLKYSILSVAFGAINLIYILIACGSLARGPALRWLGLFVVFIAIRSAFLGTLENPETRYTLECYPVLIVFAATWRLHAKEG